MMISLSWIPLLLLTSAPPAAAQSPNGVTSITSVEPASGKPGDVLKATGVSLDKEKVTALYLTDGTVDIKAVIVEHTATALSFRIPSEAKPGRFALMVLVGRAGEERLLEQPVKITVKSAGAPST